MLYRNHSNNGFVFCCVLFLQRFQKYTGNQFTIQKQRLSINPRARGGRSSNDDFFYPKNKLLSW